MPNRRVEHDKIRIWPSLGEAWWLAILPLPPLGFAIWLGFKGEAAPTVVMAIMFVFIVAFVATLLSPRATSLELRADGIEARTMGWRARRFLWRDIEAILRLKGRGGETVGWQVRRHTVGRRSDAGRRLVGADVVLPAYLCSKAAALESLLKAAQAAALAGRWADFVAAERAAVSHRADAGRAKANGQGGMGNV
ncbi:MAG: hypothetical protein KIT16_16500 [Rhodospirillaceae bacterium]|nr:hypothetical protein [Rhodospirillaceae bacterium]